MRPNLTLNRRLASESESREIKALTVILRDEFEIAFRFYDSANGDRVEVVGVAEDVLESHFEERGLAFELASEQESKVFALSDHRYLLGFPLDGIGPVRIVAIGIMSALARSRPDIDQEQWRLTKWTQSVHQRLRLSKETSERQRSQVNQDRQSTIALDAIMSLERLHCSVQIHKDPHKNHARILRTARELLGASTVAWVPLSDGDVVSDGERLLSPWDLGQIANCVAEQNLGNPSGYVLINETKASRWGTRFPQITNVLGVPVAEKSLSGWVLALNKRQISGRKSNGHDQHVAHDQEGTKLSPAESQPFRRLDAALLMPFASLLGLHTRASQRYSYIKDVMVGLTRSLIAAIDAKDEYTCGHSERVARVAVELGRELGMSESEQNDMYLAGLLHDIGKIGIRDDVLNKRGPLTEDEFKHVQQHPVIGQRILSGLKTINHLLPGVLYHHERYDGTGYPEGLSGDSIPLLARILAVADGFDAINSTRSYRVAMPAERVDQILRDGASTQWDPMVIEAYFRARDRLVAIHQCGLGDSLRHALDGAMRHGVCQDHLTSAEFTIAR